MSMTDVQKTRAFHRVRVATVFLFSFVILLVGSVAPAKAGNTNFALRCIVGGCAPDSNVWYNFSTDKDSYNPGETIGVQLVISSDDHPKEPLCPVVELGINNANYTGDLVSGCYTAEDFRGQVFLNMSRTAPMTSGSFNLSFAVGLSGYNIPGVKNIPLTVSAPAGSTLCACGDSVLYRPDTSIPMFENDFTCDSDKKLRVANAAVWSGQVCNSTVTAGPGMLSCVADPSCTNRMDVSSNISGASYTLTGPATLTGSGVSSSHSGQPTGVYTITWNAVAGYATPASDAQMLGDYGTISFSGNYSVIVVPPPVTINVSF